MSKTTMTIIAVLVVIFIGGAFYYAAGDDDAQNSQQNNTLGNALDQSNQSDEVPAGWATYSSTSTPRFTFQHPSDALVDPEADRVRVRVIGPESGQNTEITDGFLFYVMPLEGTAAASLQAKAQQRFAKATVQIGATSELEQTTIAGAEAYTFDVENELGGETTHIIFDDSGMVFEVTYTISEPAGVERDYRETVETMVGTVSGV